jgi:hypothetical protein
MQKSGTHFCPTFRTFLVRKNELRHHRGVCPTRQTLVALKSANSIFEIEDGTTFTKWLQIISCIWAVKSFGEHV